MKDQIEGLSKKFDDPLTTASGETRATVKFSNPQTLWFNTGTLCNITCKNCYIESSPTNDRLVYLTAKEVVGYLDQLRQREWPVREIGITGGEPFMNPEILEIIQSSLEQGYEVLVLTNAMQPMMRSRIQRGLQKLNAEHPGKLTLRVSLDHHSKEIHDLERGKGSFNKTIAGLKWLREGGFQIAVAGRATFGETEAESRGGFARLYEELQLSVDAFDPSQTVLFPEMDMNVDVPEITTSCWGILNKSPSDVMCASSRMVVKRQNQDSPVVLACTLIAYDPQFEMGQTLEQAEGPVALNHPHCAKFCVLGGASCSA